VLVKGSSLFDAVPDELFHLLSRSRVMLDLAKGPLVNYYIFYQYSNATTTMLITLQQLLLDYDVGLTLLLFIPFSKSVAQVRHDFRYLNHHRLAMPSGNRKKKYLGGSF